MALFGGVALAALAAAGPINPYGVVTDEPLYFTGARLVASALSPAVKIRE